MPACALEKTCVLGIAGAHRIVVLGPYRIIVRDYIVFFFFNDTATTEIYTLSLHDALPIFGAAPTLASLTAAGEMDCYSLTGAVADDMRLRIIKTVAGDTINPVKIGRAPV